MVDGARRTAAGLIGTGTMEADSGRAGQARRPKHQPNTVLAIAQSDRGSSAPAALIAGRVAGHSGQVSIVTPASHLDGRSAREETRSSQRGSQKGSQMDFKQSPRIMHTACRVCVVCSIRCFPHREVERNMVCCSAVCAAACNRILAGGKKASRSVRSLARKNARIQQEADNARTGSNSRQRDASPPAYPWEARITPPPVAAANERTHATFGSAPFVRDGVLRLPYSIVHRPIEIDDGIGYLQHVRAKCAPSIYNELFKVLKDIEEQAIDTRAAIERVIQLFLPIGHRELIFGFNAFLPLGYSIDVPDDEELPRVVVPTKLEMETAEAELAIRREVAKKALAVAAAGRNAADTAKARATAGEQRRAAKHAAKEVAIAKAAMDAKDAMAVAPIQNSTELTQMRALCVNQKKELSAMVAKVGADIKAGQSGKTDNLKRKLGEASPPMDHRLTTCLQASLPRPSLAFPISSCRLFFLGEAILERGHTPAQLMKEWDRNGDGQLSLIGLPVRSEHRPILYSTYLILAPTK